MHASILLTYEVTEYAFLFAEIVDAYFDKKLYADVGPKSSVHMKLNTLYEINLSSYKCFEGIQLKE
jgi:hypothetical protein